MSGPWRLVEMVLNAEQGAGAERQAMDAGFPPGTQAPVLQVGARRFQAFTQGEGDLVLLIHGFPDGPETFAALMPALAAGGYKAVAVTLRGYETATLDAADTYSLLQLAGDVTGWMDALGVARAHLVGHDWGASIAFAAAAAAPDRVLSLTMVAVPHPARFQETLRSDLGQFLRSTYMVFFQIRGFADWWVGLFNAAFVARIWRRWSPGWRPGARTIGRVRRRFADPRVRRAALDYYRSAFDARAPDARPLQALFAAPLATRAFGICGADDGCIGADVFVRCMRPEDFAGGVEVARIARAGHFVHAEKPQEVASLLIPWLGRGGAGGAPPPRDPEPGPCP